jgi:hypothetical protein
MCACVICRKAGSPNDPLCFLCWEHRKLVKPETIRAYEKATKALRRLGRFADEDFRDRVWSRAVALMVDLKNEARDRAAGDLIERAS